MINFRTTNIVVFLACSGLIATAYYMEYVMYLDPCPLCMVQRYVIILLGVVCLAAFLHNPSRRGKISYSIVQLVVCAGGAAVFRKTCVVTECTDGQNSRMLSRN